ncbi:MAG: hypothetical protein ACFE8M_04700 [Candidatus Hermodarchaeota archaeon]
MESVSAELDEFVESIKNSYESLNNNAKFKDEFKDATFKILLVPKDGEFAALIKVDNGTVSVEGVKSLPKENIEKDKLGWDGYMKTIRQTFKDIGDGKLTSRDIRKKVLARKIKVKGLKYLASFSKMAELRRQN